MIYELIELLTHYKNRYADNYFVNQVLIIISKYHDISGYIKDLLVIDKKNSFESSYNFYKKTLTINLYQEHNKEISKHLINDDYIYYFNLSVLKTILHEFEHIMQEKKKVSKEDSIEKKLIVLNDITCIIDKNEFNKEPFIKRIKLKRDLRSYHKYYLDNHDLAPVERMANIRSSSNMKLITDEIKDKNTGVIAFSFISEFQFFDQLMNGYYLIDDITNSPSLDFLSNMKKTNNREIINNDLGLNDFSLSFENRLLYGLKLTKEEYNTISLLNNGKKR